MKLLKPSWVSHNGKPIFSVDIHPDGTKFATGGQGKISTILYILSCITPAELIREFRS
uniref:Uncharacterized protein n=1 Tax=Labrus bergylta TaxID=56723 RepID=A0A3Q3GW60_9LABR